MPQEFILSTLNGCFFFNVDQELVCVGVRMVQIDLRCALDNRDLNICADVFLWDLLSTFALILHSHLFPREAHTTVYSFFGHVSVAMSTMKECILVVLWVVCLNDSTI